MNDSSHTNTKSNTPTPTLTHIDKAITELDCALRTLFANPQSMRPNPAKLVPAEQTLSPEAQSHAGQLMRVNHVGEICAQALYRAQALTSTTAEDEAFFLQAAQEETDHLSWTAERLKALNSRLSLLNPLWYVGAFSLGLVAGRLGRNTSLGFMQETEHQVEQHLEKHLNVWPQADAESIAVLQQMKQDEAKHSVDAQHAGASTLPWPIRTGMRLAAKIMTKTARWV